MLMFENTLKSRILQNYSHSRVPVLLYLSYGITGCRVFKAGIQNWKGFCIKTNCSQMKLLNFENWTNREPQ